MRSGSLLWFLGGVLAGAIGLYLVLWSGGVLSPYLAQVRAESRPPERRPEPEPARHEPPRAAAPVGRTPRHADDKAMVLPIEGLKASEILDTYAQGRPGGRTHEATDIMAARGTPVHAMVDGVIKKLFTSKAGGLTVYEFDEPGEYCYYYAHLDRYVEGIHEGMQVARGTVIGYVGSTGDANPNAPHLHLGISVVGPDKAWWKTTPVNPYPILMGILR